MKNMVAAIKNFMTSLAVIRQAKEIISNYEDKHEEINQNIDCKTRRLTI